MKNVTIKKMVESSNIPASLIRGTVKQFGGFDMFKDSASDVVNHGIDSGFGMFVYYEDTVKFFRKHRHSIIELAEQQANDLGMGMLEMIASFNCIKSLDISIDEIAKSIYTSRGEVVDQIQNCLAWYTGEEVARLYVDMLED